MPHKDSVIEEYSPNKHCEVLANLFLSTKEFNLQSTKRKDTHQQDLLILGYDQLQQNRYWKCQQNNVGKDREGRVEKPEESFVNTVTIRICKVPECRNGGASEEGDSQGLYSKSHNKGHGNPAVISDFARGEDPHVL